MEVRSVCASCRRYAAAPICVHLCASAWSFQHEDLKASPYDLKSLNCSWTPHEHSTQPLSGPHICNAYFSFTWTPFAAAMMTTSTMSRKSPWSTTPAHGTACHFKMLQHAVRQQLAAAELAPERSGIDYNRTMQHCLLAGNGICKSLTKRLQADMPIALKGEEGLAQWHL